MTQNTQPDRNATREKKQDAGQDSAKLDLDEAQRNALDAEGDDSEDHLGATEDEVGDRTGSGVGYDQPEVPEPKPGKGGVA